MLRAWLSRLPVKEFLTLFVPVSWPRKRSSAGDYLQYDEAAASELYSGRALDQRLARHAVEHPRLAIAACFVSLP